MENDAFDGAKAEAFAGSVIGIISGGMLSMMLSIGNSTGLLDRMAEMEPATSDEIAKAAGLNERYVREWLGAMVIGRIVDYQPEGRTYHLPPEHAAFLTTAAGPNNLATFAGAVACFGGVEDDVADSFRRGGGVPYAKFDKFQTLMAKLSGQTFDATLVGGTLPLVPGLTERLRAGIDVADLGCGSGHAVNVMAKAFPSSRFAGYDFSDEAIGAARGEASSMGLQNARFEKQDIAELDAHEQFDLIAVFDAIHDQAKPARVLSVIYGALRPGGVFLCADVAASSVLEENFEHPMAAALYAVSTMHCMTVSLAQDGEGLGAMWGEQKALAMMREAGFTEIEIKRVEGDILNNYYVARK